MLVVRAEHMGMCFGVKDALEAMRAIEEPEKVTVHGELVHNPVVLSELESRGFRQQKETQRASPPQTPEVLITAHGVSDSKRDEFEAQGYKVHDTTCPLVRRVHKACLHYQKKGFFIVVLGRKGHVEVEGLIGDLNSYALAQEVGDLERYRKPKIAVLNQTTMREALLPEFHQRIRALNPESQIEFVNTSCQPTKDRQNAVAELLNRVQALVVVGGATSNNTHQLGLRAQERGLPWIRVSNADELPENWFQGVRVVGLTAGTSTTDETVREVEKRLRKMGGSHSLDRSA